MIPRCQMSEIKDFLNPNSMLTPGIAGGITMMIANSLWVNFDFPPKYTAIVMCLLLGLMVLAELKAPIWQKPVYYIINVLIIFSVSAGSNVVGMSASQAKLLSEANQLKEQKLADVNYLQKLSGFIISNANAEANARGKPAVSNNNEKRENKSHQQKTEKNLRELPKAKNQLSAKKKHKTFFRPWF